MNSRATNIDQQINSVASLLLPSFRSDFRKVALGYADTQIIQELFQDLLYPASNPQKLITIGLAHLNDQKEQPVLSFYFQILGELEMLPEEIRSFLYDAMLSAEGAETEMLPEYRAKNVQEDFKKMNF